MRLSRERLSDLLRDGFLALILGLSLSLLSLAPESLIEPLNRFNLGVALTLLVLGSVGVKLFYEDFQEYKHLSARVDRYLNKMPKTVDFDKYRRTVRINENGDSDVKDRMRIRNISESTINTMDIPSFCDIYEGSDLELLEREPHFQVNEIVIDGDKISNTETCYDRTGILFGNDYPEEKGHITIPFDQVGGLPSEDEGNNVSNLSMNYTVNGALDEAINGEKDAFAYSVHHLTNEVEISLHPPQDHAIQIERTDEHPDGILVRDMRAGITDIEEMNRVETPNQINDERLEWRIEDPRLNYRYYVYFSCPSATTG